jgi:hypothetical protein
MQIKRLQNRSERKLRRTTLGIARKRGCQRSYHFVAKQGLNRNSGTTKFGAKRCKERLGSGNARNRMRKERAQRAETRLPAVLFLRFLPASDRAPVRPVLPAARWHVALHTTNRQRRKKRSRTKEQNKQSCEYASQSKLRVQQRVNPSNRPWISYRVSSPHALGDHAVAGRSCLA